MKTVRLLLVFMLGVMFAGPWPSRVDRATIVQAMQRTLPQLLYTCPMHPEVLEDKAGTCPVCKMKLEPVRIEQDLWYACPIHAATLGPSPGVCPLDKRQKMPVIVTVHWACSDSPDQKLMEPGRCSDGSSRREIHQIRAHGDHNPRHGGQFYMAADSWHHVEGTYPQPGLFRVYFYDNFTQPIDVKSFAARLVSNGRADLPLKPGRGNTMEASLSNASIPLTLTLKVKFAGDTPESQFDFTFNELSKEPATASPISKPRATAATPPTPRPAPPAAAATAAAAPPSASAPTAASVPTLTNCTPNVSRTDLLLMSDALPKDTRSLVDLLAMCRTEVQKLIDGGQFGFVYQPTMLGKDIALALESHMNTLPERQHVNVSDSIRSIVLSSWQLDMYGDLGNRVKLDEAFKVFAKAIDDIGSAYAPKP